MTPKTTVSIAGAAGLLAMACLFSLPVLLATPLSRERAEREIRQHLKWQLSLELSAKTKAAGLASPDARLAEDWHAHSRRLDGLEFVRLEIKRFLFVPPFSSSRMYVAKVASRDAERQERTRYFSLSARSRRYDVFWVAEQPWLMWLLSI